MKTLIKSALNQVRTEDKLNYTTKVFLESHIVNSQNIPLKTRGEFRLKKIVIAACVVLFLCGVSVGGYAYYQTPVNYISLDINPSVELGVNALGKVISASSYNEDGAIIMKDQKITNCAVEDAVRLLVQSAANNGFINSDGSTVISLTAETKNTGTAASLEESAGQGAQKAIQSSGSTAVIFKTNIALDRRDEARKLGITPGKLNLIQKLQALDPTATVEEYRNAKVTEIMEKIVELRKSADSNNSQIADLSSIENAVAQVEQNREQEKNQQTGQNQEQNRQQETNGSSNGGTSGNSNGNGNLKQSENANNENGNGNNNGNGNGNNKSSNNGKSNNSSATTAANAGGAGQGNIAGSSAAKSGQDYSAGQGYRNAGDTCPIGSTTTSCPQSGQNSSVGQNGTLAKGKTN